MRKESRAPNQLRKHPLALWPIRWYNRKTVESRENLPQAEGEVASRARSLNLSQCAWHQMEYTSKRQENAGISLGHGA